MQTNLVIKIDENTLRLFQGLCLVRRTTMTKAVNKFITKKFFKELPSDEEGLATLGQEDLQKITTVEEGFATLSQDDLDNIITGNFDDELETFTFDNEVY